MEFLRDEKGAVSIEIAIITIVLIAVALAFKGQVLSLCKAIADKILG